MHLSVRIIITCLIVYCPNVYGQTKQDTSEHNQGDTTTAFRGTIKPDRQNIYPYNSIQQLLKGNAAGVYVQEPTAEPGAMAGVLLRGTAIPFISARNMYEAQPAIILDGIPLIMDHPFTYDIQEFDFNHLGPSTNIFSAINLNNVESIEVIKDYGEAAVYGPRAVNGGVIVINTKTPVTGKRRISFNTYFGIVTRPRTTTTNAKFENDFRQEFYNKYATTEELQTYPLYLRDSTNNAYYGPSNWTDRYFKNTPIYGVDASLSSGSDRANFLFSAGNQRSANAADRTRLDRYNAMFKINMIPLKNFTVSAMLSAARLERKRNTFLRDRFAEMQYLPDLSNPLPPNKQYYGQYLKEFDKSFDDNKSNEVSGYFNFKVKFTDWLSITSHSGFDYNEGLRDAFFPSTLLETVNYLSNYFAYNQRVFVNNTINVNFKHFQAEAGQVFQADFNRYNYAYAYKGPNDLIRVNLLHSDNTKDDYLSPKSFNHALMFSFLDKQRHRLLSFYGKVNYEYNNFNVGVMLRADGSSSAQPDNWWFYSPTFTAGWNINHNNRLHASWGRIGRLMPDDRFGEGPQYTSDLSFSNNPVRFSYNGFPGISRAYSSGYIGYGIKWPYSDQLNIGYTGTVKNISIAIDLYQKSDNNMLIEVPFSAEYGYSYQFKNGMKVQNQGVDLTVATSIKYWSPAVYVNYNRNRLKALPNNLNQLVINNRLLKVGHAIDQYWLLTNNGIYNQDPRNLNYKGIPIQAGDPKWQDLNKDNTIDDNDKQLKGHALPVVSGGFTNDFSYKNFTLGINFYFALGRKIMNSQVADHFDFINREGKIDMSAVKEITFWSKAGDYHKYPRYNPWSTVDPYRIDQDLWLENGVFLKLRTLSLQYTIPTKKYIKHLSVYATASNLFTITKYTGGDPETVDYNGYDNGYSLPFTKTYTLGIKMDL